MLVRVLILLLSFVWIPCGMAADTTSQFKGVSVDKKSGDIKFDFSSKLNLKEAPKLSYFDTYFEFKLPDSSVDQAKFFDVDSEYIQKVGVYPTSSTSMGVRLFTDKDGSLERYQLSNLKLRDSTINFSFDKVGYLKLKEATSKQNEKIASTSQEEARENNTTTSLASTNNKEELNSKSNESVLGSSTLKLLYDKSQKSVKDNALNLKNSNIIKDNIKSIAMFLTIMVLGCLALYFSRRILGKGLSKKADAALKIKTLAVSSISPKQKISLVEVCGERILLGITPTNVSFITKVGQASSSLTLSSYNSKFSENTETSFLSRPKTIGNTGNTGISTVLENKSSKEEKVLSKNESVRNTSPVVKNTTGRESFSDDLDNYDYETGDMISTPVAPVRVVTGGTSVDVDKTKTQSFESTTESTKSSIDSVTKLIREKLKNLPSMN